MRPEDYNDENGVPSEEDFAPERVDEKAQLRKSITKGCRANTIFYSIAALFFLINGIVHLDNVNENKLYLCPLIAAMLVSALAMGTYAFAYERIRHASTAREMRNFLNLMGPESMFSKLLLITLTLCFIIAAVLGLIDKMPWYVVVLAVLGIAAIIGWLWWLIKRSASGDSRDTDIERLMELEEKEKRNNQ